MSILDNSLLLGGGAGGGPVTIKMWGAGGGTGHPYGPVGGAGGYATGTFTFASGTTLIVRVGGAGIYVQKSSGTNAGGWPGGGISGNANSNSQGAGGGGGYSGVFVSTTPVLIAGAGGGCGYFDTQGGAGGGSSGQTAVPRSGYTASTGGTQSAGGTTGSPYSGQSGNGSSLQGGPGSNGSDTTSGGGGGGYYGGGGGGYSSSGGGGSGFATTNYSATGTTLTAGSYTTPGNSSDSDRGTAGNPQVNGKLIITQGTTNTVFTYTGSDQTYTVL